MLIRALIVLGFFTICLAAGALGGMILNSLIGPLTSEQDIQEIANRDGFNNWLIATFLRMPFTVAGALAGIVTWYRLSKKR